MRSEYGGRYVLGTGLPTAPDFIAAEEREVENTLLAFGSPLSGVGARVVQRGRGAASRAHVASISRLQARPKR